jgi:hypothetical protein
VAQNKLSANFAPLQPVQYEQWSEVNVLGMVVKLDGLPYSAMNATWTENGHGAADTLTVTIPLSSNPDFPTQLFRGTYGQFVLSQDAAGALDPNQNAQFLAANTSPTADVVVELWVGFPESPTVAPTSVDQLKRWFIGEVDVYSGKFGMDTVTFSARSLAAHFVDDKLTNISLNQTVGQFLADQAKKYGLPAPIVNISGVADGSIKAATIQEVLAYDQIAGSNLQASMYGMHPADLLTRAAQVDDTDWWIDVTDGTPHYESPGLVQRGAPIDTKFGRDWEDDAEAQHSPQFSKNVLVVAYTHQPHTRTTTAISVSDDGFGNISTTQTSGSATAEAIAGTNEIISTSTHIKKTTGTSTTTSSVRSTSTSGGNNTLTASQGRGESAKQRYPLYLGNTDPQRAVAIAQAYRRQITQHEYTFIGTLPITRRLLNTLSITSLFRIHGLPWALTNGTYYPRSMEYTASVEEGFKVHITALSHALAQGGV